MRKPNSSIRRSLCTLAIVAVLAAGRTMLAQAPGPTDGMEPAPNMQPPKMNIDKELSRMSKRYGLSDAQRTQIRPILEEFQKKLDDVFKVSPDNPEERFSRMRSVHEDQVAKISAMLSDYQRSKYQKDQERMPGDMGPGGPPPPPRGSDPGGPPPPQ